MWTCGSFNNDVHSPRAHYQRVRYLGVKYKAVNTPVVLHGLPHEAGFEKPTGQRQTLSGVADYGLPLDRIRKLRDENATGLYGV